MQVLSDKAAVALTGLFRDARRPDVPDTRHGQAYRPVDVPTHWVLTTSGTPTSGRYPGKIQYQKSDATWADLGFDVWVVHSAGTALTNATRYHGRFAYIHTDSKPVFVTSDAASGGGVDTDEKVKVSSSDATAGYLKGKLGHDAVAAGATAGGYVRSLAFYEIAGDGDPSGSRFYGSPYAAAVHARGASNASAPFISFDAVLVFPTEVWDNAARQGNMTHYFVPPSNTIWLPVGYWHIGAQVTVQAPSQGGNVVVGTVRLTIECFNNTSSTPALQQIPVIAGAEMTLNVSKDFVLAPFAPAGIRVRLHNYTNVPDASLTYRNGEVWAHYLGPILSQP